MDATLNSVLFWVVEVKKQLLPSSHAGSFSHAGSSIYKPQVIEK